MQISLIMKDTLVNVISDLFINNEILSITNNFLIDSTIIILIIFAPITIIHELIHGSVYKLFGGKVKYKFKGIYAYIHSGNFGNYSS